MLKNKLLLIFLIALIPGCSCMTISKQELDRALKVCENNEGVKTLATDAATGSGAAVYCGNGARFMLEDKKG